MRLIVSAAAWLLAFQAPSWGQETPSGPGPVPGPTLVSAKPAGKVEGYAHSYQDDNRLYVTSVAAGIEHPVLANLSLRARAVADWITILAGGKAEAAPVDPHAGHPGHEGEQLPEYENPVVPDAISGASARVSSNSSDTRETRLEGVLGATLRGRMGGNPAALSADGRFSHEPDYESWSGAVSGREELFKGNTSVTAFAAAGRDRISPPAAPAGQAGRWPASQTKLSGGFSVLQSATPGLLLSGGASAAMQAGTLSSPYRNSLVGITYFPEKLPSERLRGTAFLQASYYLGLGTALHARQGLYADDWGVTAWIPEAAIAKELGSHALLTLRHRFYAQSSASFYKPVYPDRKGFQTGDLRLGTIYDQTGSALAEYTVRAASGPLTLSLEYAFSHREYPELGPKVVLSHVFSAGVHADY